MLQLGYIEIDYVNAGILKVTPLGRKVLFGEQKAMMAIYKEPEEKTNFRRKDSKFKYRPIKPIQSASVEETLLDSLQQLRKQIAEREQTPAYIIFSDDSLEDMVQKRPVNPGRVQRNTRCGRNQTGKIRKGIRGTDTVRTAVAQRQITAHFYFSFPIIRLRSKNYRYSKKRDGSYKNIRYFSLRKRTGQYPSTTGPI